MTVTLFLYIQSIFQKLTNLFCLAQHLQELKSYFVEPYVFRFSFQADFKKNLLSSVRIIKNSQWILESVAKQLYSHEPQRFERVKSACQSSQRGNNYCICISYASVISRIFIALTAEIKVTCYAATIFKKTLFQCN